MKYCGIRLNLRFTMIEDKSIGKSSYFNKSLYRDIHRKEKQNHT